MAGLTGRPVSGTAAAAVLLLMLHGAFAQDGVAARGDDGLFWYDFHASWHRPLPAPVAMGARLLDAPAGKHGHVRVRGNRLEFEDGTPARFWGIGIAFSNDAGRNTVPPPKGEARTLARRIASYGFNHVRFGGLDGTAPRAILNWLKTGRLESENLDRLDNFIAELRRLGIYYSFSINNNSHKLFERTGVIDPNTAERYPFSRFRTVRLFSDAAQARIAEWTRAFFSHRNPYTGLTYGEDPANVYFSAINEDTAALGFYAWRHRIDAAWQDRISDSYSRFLAKRYRSRDALSQAWAQSGRIGLLPWEDPFTSRIAFRPLTGKRLLSDARIRDMGRFVVSVDRSLARRVRAGIRGAGYRGPFTITNKWYGYGNLYASYLEGDYVEGHLYFGSPVPGKRNEGVAVINNLSYLEDPEEGGSPLNDHMTDTGSHLARILPTHLVDRPYIISEWNHFAWSDHAYEGPFILTGFAARTGIDGLDMHTFFNHPRPDYRDNVPKKSFTVAGNPLYTAILPTLALSFLRGDIGEAAPAEVVCVGRDEDEIMLKALRLPAVPAGMLAAVRRHGPYRVRAALAGGCAASGAESRPDTRPGPVRWERAGGAGRLIVETPRFNALVGDLDGAGAGILRAGLEWPGAASAISLDGRPLADSACVLVTVAGPVRNRGARWRYRGGRKEILDIGTGTPQMRGNRGRLTVLLNARRVSGGRAIGIGGKTVEAPIRQRESGGLRAFEITPDAVPAPWFVFGDGDCLKP